MSDAAAIGTDAYAIPLDQLNPARPELFQADAHWPFFERLRREAPVHYTAESEFGPYWSVTKYKDIMAVDTNHAVFSSLSTLGGISIRDQNADFPLPMFIAMDPPRHDAQRLAVSPIVAPANLAHLEGLIRQRAAAILDALPRGEAFDFVDRVSIELTTQMLATLFDFPFADRRKLTRWSDVATAAPGSGIVDSEEQRQAELRECLACFMGLWNDRLAKPGGNDLIAMLQASPATRDMPPQEFLGNIILLIVGGNDTTRNSLTGGLYAFSKFPGEWEKLKANPALLDSAVPEIVRWQTPIAHMRRTALADAELGGQHIRKGERVVMWYVSGNRDEEMIDRPMELVIDRKRPRQHLAFGFGIHRCVGNRLAEMQLRIVWEEILRRKLEFEVLEEPTRVLSTFIKGYGTLKVKIAA
ncbi:MAG: cytochrome P450 [Acetobacteraceae bacterium]|nr:cytochrome P450 [Acetobacteraceae bacterium]